MKPLEQATVLACGAWLKNQACLLSQGQVYWSAPHGDLRDPEACRALSDSVTALQAQAGGRLRAIAHDLHPDFFSTRLAQALAADLGLPAVAVQHHHAHIAAVLAEHQFEDPVVGLALDGVGLGSDGRAWGGELLAVSAAGWQRLACLSPLCLPGGDVAAREPWRMAAAALHALGRTQEIGPRFGPHVGAGLAGHLQQMLMRNLNCPLTSSTGRWFDAAAGALGLCLRQRQEAEAAIALETLAQSWLVDHPAPSMYPPLPTLPAQGDWPRQLDLRPLLQRLLDTPQELAQQTEAAAWFHLRLADGLAHWLAQAAAEQGVSTVCLSGGCFMNKILRERLRGQLQHLGLSVLLPQAHSCGDAGLALGQAWVAAHALNTQASPAPSFESCPSCA
ncbi:Kae1-like domain-containing protein [Roseateles koreensis]|uniref:Carbamoyltransferase HypF n=1 Tax=Roseateles koreensis TaxID=2987526 RepID=A0ABT5KTJ7_9BURK|nr:carbamoyltransferase HypF [Roseateles koreensis]MDC8786136.1 carbamoyltransferase HypF [Roseateles koreensis]